MIVNNFLARAQALTSQQKIELEGQHLENPTSVPLFQDAEDRLFHELKSLEPAELELDVRARFRTFLSEPVPKLTFHPYGNCSAAPDQGVSTHFLALKPFSSASGPAIQRACREFRDRL
jgi:hypothetical protein